jgi:hypothetical protein
MGGELATKKVAGHFFQVRQIVWQTVLLQQTGVGIDGYP